MKESEKWYHVAFGIHSGIPDCCILWWLKSTEKSRLRAYRESQKGVDVDTGYLPCPKCRKKKRYVKVHMCNHDNPMCMYFVDNHTINWYINAAKQFGIAYKRKTARQLLKTVDAYIKKNFRWGKK